MRAVVQRVVDLLLPPRCLACGVELSDESGLCPRCWAAAQFISTPYCVCCGLPFDIPDAGQTLCAVCAAEPPPFARARAALVYDDLSRGLILRFKHAGKGGSAKIFARWMATAAGPLLTEADVIVPTPLHPWRLLSRGYNQAALLSRRLAEISGVAHLPDGLMRRRATESQGRLSRLGRRRNLSGAVAAHPRRAAAMVGKRVLLVDDVYTTGATAAACARAVLRAGALQVDVITLTRALLSQRG